MTDSTAAPTRRTHARSGDASITMRNGREFVTFPVVPLRELVYHYPERDSSEYLPAESIAESVDTWAGTPIVPKHPETRTRSAVDPDVYMGDSIGELHDVALIDNGTAIAGTAYVDVEKARSAGDLAADVVDRLLGGETLSVSAGYGTIGDTPESGTFNGESYDAVQGPPVNADHVAVFPDDAFTARCTPEQGCRANATDAEDADADGRRFSSLLTRLTNSATGDDATDAGDDETPQEDAAAIRPGPVGDYYVETEAAESEAESAAESDTSEADAEDEPMLVDIDDDPRDEEQTDDHDPGDGAELPDEQIDAIAARVLERIDELADAEDADADADVTANASDSTTCNCGPDVSAYPAAGRTSYERRKQREELGLDLEKPRSGGCSCDDADDDETVTNYAAVPGEFDRTPPTPADDLGDVPAAGRSAYEKRKNSGDDAGELRTNASSTDERARLERREREGTLSVVEKRQLRRMRTRGR